MKQTACGIKMGGKIKYITFHHFFYDGKICGIMFEANESKSRYISLVKYITI